MTDIEETCSFRWCSYGRYTGSAILFRRPTVMTIII